jgi:hypothetical protein
LDFSAPKVGAIAAISLAACRGRRKEAGAHRRAPDTTSAGRSQGRRHDARTWISDRRALPWRPAVAWSLDAPLCESALLPRYPRLKHRAGLLRPFRDPGGLEQAVAYAVNKGHTDIPQSNLVTAATQTHRGGSGQPTRGRHWPSVSDRRCRSRPRLVGDSFNSGCQSAPTLPL